MRRVRYIEDVTDRESGIDAVFVAVSSNGFVNPRLILCKFLRIEFHDISLPSVASHMALTTDHGKRGLTGFTPRLAIRNCRGGRQKGVLLPLRRTFFDLKARCGAIARPSRSKSGKGGRPASSLAGKLIQPVAA